MDEADKEKNRQNYREWLRTDDTAELTELLDLMERSDQPSYQIFSHDPPLMNCTPKSKFGHDSRAESLDVDKSFQYPFSTFFKIPSWFCLM
jgi:hypothetical protein